MINDNFSILIREYTVSRSDKGLVSYLIKNNQILINGKEINEDITDKINKIKNLINSKITEIETISNSIQRNYKGGIQKMLHIEFDGQKYNIIGNTSNEKAVNLYIEIKENIKKIIN